MSSDEYHNDVDDFNEQFDQLDEKSDRLGNDDDAEDNINDNMSEISSSMASTDQGEMPMLGIAAEAQQALLEPYDFANLPSHACAYCGVHDE